VETQQVSVALTPVSSAPPSRELLHRDHVRHELINGDFRALVKT